MKNKKRERGQLTVKLFHRVIFSTNIVSSLLTMARISANGFSIADVVSSHSTVFITSDYQVRIDDSLEARTVIDCQAKTTSLKYWDFECVLLFF